MGSNSSCAALGKNLNLSGVSSFTICDMGLVASAYLVGLLGKFQEKMHMKTPSTVPGTGRILNFH